MAASAGRRQDPVDLEARCDAPPFEGVELLDDLHGSVGDLGDEPIPPGPGRTRRRGPRASTAPGPHARATTGSCEAAIPRSVPASGAPGSSKPPGRHRAIHCSRCRAPPSRANAASTPDQAATRRARSCFISQGKTRPPHPQRRRPRSRRLVDDDTDRPPGNLDRHLVELEGGKRPPCPARPGELTRQMRHDHRRPLLGTAARERPGREHDAGADDAEGEKRPESSADRSEQQHSGDETGAHGGRAARLASRRRGRAGCGGRAGSAEARQSSLGSPWASTSAHRAPAGASVGRADPLPLRELPGRLSPPWRASRRARHRDGALADDVDPGLPARRRGRRRPPAVRAASSRVRRAAPRSWMPPVSIPAISVPRRCAARTGRRPRPSRWAAAPASTAGTSFKSANGAKAATASRATPFDHARDAARVSEQPRRECEHRRDHELREHKGGQGLAEPACPVRGRRPGDAGQGERQEQRRRRDRGRSDRELEPEDEGDDRGGKHDQEGSEGGEPESSGPAERADQAQQQLVGRVTRRAEHHGARLVGRRQPEGDELHDSRR